MKKNKQRLLTIVAALALSSTLVSPFAGSVSADDLNNVNGEQTNQIVTDQATEDLSWGYPFQVLAKKGVRPMYNAQIFGKTNYLRSRKPKSYFHDGWDFGWGEVGHSTVKAIHPGTVKEVAYGNGLGWFVWVISPDNYVEIYQEGFKRKKDISVKPGQEIKTGQKIGKLTGTHLHLGVTKTNKKYINKHGYPCENWWRNNGTWMNPIKIIQTYLNGLDK